ncbi:Extracellular solute-binding protein, family 7 [Rhizobium sp. CF080]|uniref:TRAP transporter substrate-binding protein DctP n=1 Tax=Rhizobium sp. (strain CF080) TaxID=1144310 RepID=UPI0002716FB0|nr:TRAP transporter substrate-binding protein DctP [Rhizobium sp. CF080]EUB98179.1 Extracellular solute-binding protein, family 7 [Rhizobium sp. CF080]
MKYLKLLATGVLAMGLCTAAVADEPIHLRIAVDSPSRGNVCVGYMDVWAKKIEAESQGRIKTELVCDGLLGKVGNSIDRVAAGVADIAWDLPLAYGARFAPLGVVGVPGLYDDPEIAAGALWNLYANGKIRLDVGSGIKLLWVQGVPNTAFYFVKAPSSLTSLAGHKIAMGSKQRAMTISAMGGTPIQLAPPEYYQAIQKGAADGVQSTTGAIGSYKLEELLHHYVYGPFGGGFTIMVMNQAKYDALSADLKKIIDDNSGYAMSRWSAAFLRDWEDNYLKTNMLSKPENKQVILTQEQLKAWQPAFDGVAKSWAESVPDGAKTIELFKAEYAAEAKKAGR